MTPKRSPEWLPAGWVIRFRRQKTGRRIPFYVKLETGQKFFLKDDVIHHGKLGGSQFCDLQPTLRQNTSENDLMQIAGKQNEHPEWLPDGWFVELKTYKTGKNTGKTYKKYVDPSSRFVFYSKPEVLKFLNNEKQKSSRSKQRESFSSLSAQKSSRSKQRESSISLSANIKGRIEKSTMVDLPPGWIKKVRVRKNSYPIKRDSYYIDPESGYVFRSKREVLSYLEAGEISRRSFLPPIRHNKHKSIVKKNLPLSTSKEQNLVRPTTRLSAKKLNLDHPITRLAANKQKPMGKLGGPTSRLTAKSQILGPSTTRVATKRKNLDCPTARLTVKKHMVYSNTRQQFSVGKVASDMGTLLSVEADKSKNRHRMRVSTETGSAITPRAQNLEETNSVRNAIERKWGVKESSNRSSSALLENVNGNKDKIDPADCEPISTLPADVMEVENSPEIKVRKSNDTNTKKFGETRERKRFDLPLRSSRRLVADRVPIGVTLSNTAAVLSETGAKALDVIVSNATLQLGPDPDKDLANQASVGVFAPSNLGTHREVGKCLEGKATISHENDAETPDVIVDEGVKQLSFVPSKGLAKQASSSVTAPSNLETAKQRGKYIQGKPVAGEQAQISETQTSDDKLELQSFFSLDPCLDFAIKTLTGAIPLEAAGVEGIVATPPASILQKKNLGETRMARSSTRRSLLSSKKIKEEECNLPCWSSKRLSKFASELEQSLSSERGPKTESCNRRTTGNTVLFSTTLADGISQKTEDRPVVGAQCNERVTTLPRESLLHKSKGPLPGQSVPAEKYPKLANVETSNKQQGPNQSFPDEYSWSNPWLEFALETPAGAIPVEHTCAVRDYFQLLLDSSSTQRDSRFTLPDSLRSNLSQCVTTAARLNAPEKQPVKQHCSGVFPSLSALGNASLPNCSCNSQQARAKANNC